MKDPRTAGVLVATPDLRPSLLSILQGLHDSGQLARVVTTLALSGAQLDRLARLPLGNRLHGLVGRRRLPDFLEGRTDCLWGRELIRATLSRTRHQRLTHHVWRWAEIGFDAAVAKHYAGRYDVVYGMEHSSLATFTAQKASGGRCILRQVTAHARTLAGLLQREAQRFPEYLTPYHRLLLADTDTVTARKEREYDLADLIVANSAYVRQSFIDQGIDAHKVIAVPTGCPPLDAVGGRAGAGQGPLRFLFVGTLSLRKGFTDLLTAWQRFAPGDHAELWVAGPMEIPVANEMLAIPGISYLGRLRRDVLSQTYRQADVLVLPTLGEGLAHTVLEALSYGLPVITTPESGCGDLVGDGKNGWLIEAGNVESLVCALGQAVERRKQLPEMGQRSREKARAWSVDKSNQAHLDYLQRFIAHNP